jgi:hypothetical protein
LLSRVESSRQLTSSLLRSDSRSVGTSSTTSSLFGGERDGDNTNSTTSDTSLLEGDDEDGDGDGDGQQAGIVVRPSSTEDSMDTGKINVEDLMLRVDTFHRSTRSFLADDAASTASSHRWETASASAAADTKTAGRGISSSASSANHATSSSSSSSLLLPSSSLSLSSSSSAPPMIISMEESMEDQIEKARMELQTLKDRGATNRQQHQEQLQSAQEDLDTSTTSYKDTLVSSKARPQQDFYKSIMKHANNTNNNNNGIVYNNEKVLELQTSLLIALHTTLETNTHQIDLWQDFILDLDKKMLREARRLKRRNRRSKDQLYDDIAKETNRNVVLYDFLELRVRIQTAEIKKLKKLLLLKPPTTVVEGDEEEEGCDDDDDDDDDEAENTAETKKDEKLSSDDDDDGANNNNTNGKQQQNFDSWARSSISQWAEGTQNIMKDLAQQVVEKSVKFGTTTTTTTTTTDNQS